MIAPMGAPRQGMGAAIINGILFAVGGYDGAASEVLRTLERFDPLANECRAAFMTRDGWCLLASANFEGRVLGCINADF